MRNTFLRFALCAIALTGIGTANAGNLLENGDFAEFNGNTPIKWQLPSSVHATLKYDTSEKPEGAVGSLKVTLDKANSGQGQVLQKFPIKPGSVYYFEGWVKSDKGLSGFVQIKLFKGGKEYQRISVKESGSGWEKVSKEFEVHEADAMAVLLRYNQKASLVGKSVWFANMSVVPANERVREPLKISLLEAIPTFNSIGVYADIVGDMSQNTEGHMVYREKGATEWKPTLGVVWHDETKQLRGSLLNLNEKTEYEVKVWMTDENLPDTPPPAVATTTTWSSDVPIGKTIYLEPGVNTEPLVITEKGTADAWIRYTGAPDGTSILDAGGKANNAIKILESEYIVIENLTIKGGTTDAIAIAKSSDIRIRRCDISNWGNPGTLLPSTNKRWGKGPFYLDEAGERINLQAGVRVSGGAERVVVENCFIHSPNGRATSWANGHPLGPTSIILSNSEGHHVIRNNDLIGAEEHRFNDTIEGAYNNKVKGGPYRDTDVQGNIMFFSNDDGIELDGGQMNVRMFNNWIESSYCGISTAPTLYGPSYIFRNLIVLEGEERGATNFAFKIGGNKSPEPGINYFFHNTIYSNSMGLRGSNWGKGPTPVQTRNNLFGLGVILYPQKALGDFDYDMLRVNSMDPAIDPWQANGVVGVEKFKDREAGDYRLSDNSAAIGKGVKLPMVNDDHRGSAPDIGAFPVGADPVFPVRKDSISLLPMSGTIEMVIGEGNKKTEKLTVNAPASLGKHWRVITSSPWLKATPETGPCDGQPHEITVSFDPKNDKDGLLQGAVTVRTDGGYNRSSFIKGYVKPKNEFIKIANAVDLEYAGFTVLDVTNGPVPQVLQAPDRRDASAASYIKLPVTIDKAGTYYMHALAYIPGPGSPGHDSLRLQIDDGEITYWPFGKSAPSVWRWHTADINKEQYPQKIELSAGDHVLTVWGRETLTQVAKVALSNSSIPPEKRLIPGLASAQ
ncbi:hypothetical protein [Cerasicoccus arenae]|uniref:hypothetical protein n=1 Tax=Cerasicoccus arenae TaxID=424488 RepID=UPI0016760B50|nr:hypothetical protein [Cerasicoccus arenae]